MLTTMVQIPASYLIQMHGYNRSFFRQWIYGEGIMPAKYYAYLRLGMRYEAGICTIAISMKNDFNIRHIFAKIDQRL